MLGGLVDTGNLFRRRQLVTVSLAIVKTEGEDRRKPRMRRDREAGGGVEAAGAENDSWARHLKHRRIVG